MNARDFDLYEAILQRRSTRRYDPTPLDDEHLAAVQRLVAEARPLVPGNAWGCRMVRRVKEKDLAVFLGRYGVLVSPSHMLVPYIDGGAHSLMDVGFRMEQVAVQLTRAGFASCFLGALSNEAAVNQRFSLPDGAIVGAALVFGREPEGAGGRVLNAMVRGVAGGTARRPASELFFEGQFTHFAEPPPELAALIEAGRWAPSARNVQPWRFGRVDDKLRVYVVRHSWRYGQKQDYRWFDVGACLGNMHLAALAHGQWLAIDLSEAGREIGPDAQGFEIAASVRIAAAARGG